jgi:hypothetical protein
MKPYISSLLGTHSKTSACTGKRKLSQESAEKAVLAMAQKHREPFQSYRCRHCDFWHVGHPLYWRRRGKKRKRMSMKAAALLDSQDYPDCRSLKGRDSSVYRGR